MDAVFFKEALPNHQWFHKRFASPRQQPEENGAVLILSPEQRKKKIPHISGSWVLEFLFCFLPVSKPQHRRIVGEKIRAYRKQVQLSQERLAEKASLNPKYVSEVECGYVNISLDALVRIAKALDVPLRDLVADL